MTIRKDSVLPALCVAPHVARRESVGRKCHTFWPVHCKCHVPSCSTASVCSALPAAGPQPKNTQTASACVMAHPCRDERRHSESSATGMASRNASSCVLPPLGCTTNDAYQLAPPRRLRFLSRPVADELLERAPCADSDPNSCLAVCGDPLSQVKLSATICGAALKARCSSTMGSDFHAQLQLPAAPRSTRSWCSPYSRLN